ncbi:aldo/keto reductase [Haliangium ochraceum]|uniref:Aldo/keto reductase n=1 Tax=Haliangium ochraceum (strain DSM 14365 / JCM 11303 / SMP-2) TaxID=502025 RepID=D0LHA6_HALO1|nr:aldo/keto reductase [Haliangium ochraceum]ACY18251.1 aldo/keto reductase [Haliangium ochraceum DSM 14365]
MSSDALPVPKIGQGTWQLEGDDSKEAIAAMRRGLDLGLSHVDTAELYGSGVVEDLVGEAIAGRRDEVFLATKVLPSNATYEGTLRACERSLQRLDTDRVDLYMLHWRGPHPLEDTFRAFEKLREQGKILRYGVSNFDVADLEEALAIVGPGKLACNQVLYHLQERAIEHAVVPWCQAHGVPVVAYSPFGAGVFPDEESDGGRALAAVAARHDASPRQVALRFLVRHEGVYTIPKAAQTEHVEDNAGALELQLEQRDVARLEMAFPRGEARPLPSV